MKSIMNLFCVIVLLSSASTLCADKHDSQHHLEEAQRAYPDQPQDATQYLPAFLRPDRLPLDDDFLVDTVAPNRLQGELNAAYAHIQHMRGENTALRYQLHNMSSCLRVLHSQMEEERSSNKQLAQERDTAVQKLRGAQEAYQFLLQQREDSSVAHQNAFASIEKLRQTIEELSRQQGVAATTSILFGAAQKHTRRMSEEKNSTQDSPAPSSITQEPKPTATESEVSSKRRRARQRAKKREPKSNVPNWRKQE